MSEVTSPRRSFLLKSAAAFGGLVGLSGLTRVGAASVTPTPAPDDTAEPWLVALTGKHKQLFHSHDNWTNGMEYAKRFRDLYAKEYGVPGAQVNSVLAAHGKTGAATYSDAAWDKYEIGKRFEVKDKKSGEFVRHNIFLDDSDDGPGMKSALSAGVVVLSCRTALRGFADWMAGEKKYGTKQEIERDLTGSLLPGIVLVPAMIIAINRAQEHGCTYQFTG